MKITTIIRSLYLVIGIACLLGIWIDKSGDLPPLAKMYGGLIAITFVGLDALPKKPFARTANTFFLLPTAATMLFPLAVLSSWHELYLLTGKSTVAALAKINAPLSTHITLLTYILSIAAAWSVSCRLFEGTLSSERNASHPTYREDMLTNLDIWVTIAITANIASVIFGLATNLHTSHSTAGPWAFLYRLLNAEVQTYLCLYVATTRWRHIQAITKVLLVILLVAFFARGMAAGERGVLLRIPYWLATIALFTNINAKIPFRRIAATLLMSLTLLPVGFAIVSGIKDGDDQKLRHRLPSARDVTEKVYGNNSIIYAEMFGWIGGRMSGYQTLTNTELTYGRRVLELAGPKAIVTSTIAAIFPNALLPDNFQTLSLGQTAAVLQANIDPTKQRHAGNFFGVTMLWIFTRYWAVLFLPAITAALFLIYNRLTGRVDFLSAIMCYTSHVIIQLMLSGNADIVMANTITGIAVATLVWLLICTAIGKGRLFIPPNATANLMTSN